MDDNLGLNAAVCIFVASAVALVLYSALVLMALWGWYVVPLGVTAISWPWAVGIICLASVFSSITPADTNVPDDFFGLLKPLYIKAFTVTLSLCFGFIFKFFV